MSHKLKGKGFKVRLQKKLHSNYPIWRIYMEIKSLYLNLAGHLQDLYIRRGNILPREHRRAYTAWSLRRLIARYRPHGYSGELFLFCTKDRKMVIVNSWRQIVTGKLNIIDLPGDHHVLLSNAECAKFASEFFGHTDSVGGGAACTDDGDGCFVFFFKFASHE